MIDKAGKSNGQLIENLISEKDLPSDPFSIFVLAIRSPVTREKYLQRIGYFFDFLGILKTNDPRSIISVEKRFNTFSVKAREDNNWLTNNIVRYLQFHRQRVERKEITGSTLRNYIKPIKLFCEQMDIEIPWRRIIRGMPCFWERYPQITYLPDNPDYCKLHNEGKPKLDCTPKEHGLKEFKLYSDK
jgi:hypothetical protein